MKVLLANSERGFRGGEHQTISLGLGFARRGCDVIMAVPPGSPVIEKIAGRIPVITAAFETPPFMTPLTLKRHISTHLPDIVHAQTSKAHTHLWIATGLLRNAPPLVVSRRVAFKVSRAGRLKYRTGVAHYIPISGAAAQSLTDAGVDAQKMTVVPSGVDLDVFRNSSGDSRLLDSWRAGGKFLIGTVGALEKEKGHGVLLRAARKVLGEHPGCILVIIGRGALEGRLKEQVNLMGLAGRIVISGLSAPLEDILPLFDLFVLPSLQEGLSTALIAALAAGLPVVASRTGGIPEVIGSDCGILVPPGDHDALARALLDLVENGGLRDRIARAGTGKAEKFNIDVTVERTIEVYERILGTAGRD